MFDAPNTETVAEPVGTPPTRAERGSLIVAGGMNAKRGMNLR